MTLQGTAENSMVLQWSMAKVTLLLVSVDVKSYLLHTDRSVVIITLILRFYHPKTPTKNPIQRLLQWRFA